MTSCILIRSLHARKSAPGAPAIRLLDFDAWKIDSLCNLDETIECSAGFDLIVLARMAAREPNPEPLRRASEQFL